MNNTQQTLPAEGMAETPLDLIVSLGAIVKEKQAEAEKLMEKLSALTSVIKQITEVMLPEQMVELGITEFKLADGTKIVLNNFYNAKIPDQCWGDAEQWLTDNGHQGIIKCGFTVTLDKGEWDKAVEARNALRAMGINVGIENKIHPSTLRAFVKEQCEAETNIPKEVFGVYEGKRVVFK